jgi:cytochrome c551
MASQPDDALHGVSGTGGNGGPDLTPTSPAKNPNMVPNQVKNGGGGMPAFSGTLSGQQIADVAACVTQEITNKK